MISGVRVFTAARTGICCIAVVSGGEGALLLSVGVEVESFPQWVLESDMFRRCFLESEG